MQKLAITMLCALLAGVPQFVSAQDEAGDAEAKALSGMSIIGNNETPKALYIVPWKSSELGVEAGLISNLLNDELRPVDKDVFVRELGFYELSAAN